MKATSSATDVLLERPGPSERAAQPENQLARDGPSSWHGAMRLHNALCGSPERPKALRRGQLMEGDPVEGMRTGREPPASPGKEFQKGVVKRKTSLSSGGQKNVCLGSQPPSRDTLKLPRGVPSAGPPPRAGGVSQGHAG